MSTKNPREPRFEPVAGYCPACGTASLFLAVGGFVTCARGDCKRPDAASDVLHDRIAMNIALDIMDEAVARREQSRGQR